MSANTTYRYPTKLKKFGIDNPFLNILVAKYESEIKWQSVVKDTDSLIAFVKNEMLPNLMKKIEWPIISNSKNYYISQQHVNLELALTTDQELNRADIEQVRQCRASDGDLAATTLLTEFINKHKNESFEKWVSLVTKKYKDNIAFQFLLLRPILDSAGAGSRRTLAAPSEDTIDWLQLRILKGRISPNNNLAKEYFLKNAFGAQQIFTNGWVYIQAGKENARKLSSFCQGSGWCVASNDYAQHYLSHTAFYVLRSNGKPVVALRVDSNKTIVECQGRQNESPDSWFEDIHFFIKTMGFKLNDRLDQYEEYISEIDFSTKNIDWWKARLIHWPFAIDFVPEDIKIQMEGLGINNLSIYFTFFPLEEIEKRLKIKFEEEDFVQALKINPQIYKDLSDSIVSKFGNTIQEACTTGWIEKIEDRELSAFEIEQIPAFVKENENYKKSILKYFPSDFNKLLTKRPKNANERINRVKLSDFITSSTDEPLDIAKLRALNIILNNQSSDFSDFIFPEELLKHSAFQEIRRTAWKDAINDNPTYYLALPLDLKKEKEFQLDKSPVKIEFLQEWNKKIEDKPWILTQKDAAPKSFRYREEALVAYINGWIPHLKSTPWQLWIKLGYKRVYLSYAALKNTQILNALVAGFRKGFDSNRMLLDKASGRMHIMPAFQLAIVLAAHSCTKSGVFIYRYQDYFKKINAQHPPSNEHDPFTIYINKFINGDSEAVYRAFYNLNGAQVFNLSSFEMINKSNRRIKSGDKYKLLLNGKEGRYILNDNLKGYVTMSTFNDFGKAILNLREGDSFKTEKYEGKVLKILSKE